MPTAILAYGYDLVADIDDTTTLLLAAAETDGRMHQPSAAGLLDGPLTASQRLDTLGLLTARVGDPHEGRIILAAVLIEVDAGDVAELSSDEDGGGYDVFEDFDETSARERLGWALRVLGGGVNNGPRWLLASVA